MDLFRYHKVDDVLIREFNVESDSEVVEKLERKCEVGSRGGFSLLTDSMGDPICRIRSYPNRIMLVAEIVRSREIVGVVRGCMKDVGIGSRETHVKMGCILGLRVSPKHRRMGIGLKLVRAIECWAIKNEAQYIYLATEKNNEAATNLFILKCDYVKFSSLLILVQPINYRIMNPLKNVKIEKLTVAQATTLYKDRLGSKEFFPVDIDVVLKEELNMGTWVSFFEEEDWGGLHCNEKHDEFTRKTPSSWAILSIWKTHEVYKLQIRGPPLFMCLYASLYQVGAKIFPCFRIPTMGCDPIYKPFGFLFLYGLHGEGERLGELISSLWCFAYNLARKIKDCRAIVTELEDSHPLGGHIPQWTSTSCIEDLWCLKKLNHAQEHWLGSPTSSQSFVDPREF